MDRSDAPNIRIVGKIKGPHGLKGLVKVSSYTDPPVNLKNFSAVYLSKDEGVSWGNLLEMDRVDYWLSKGAQPTDMVKKLVSRARKETVEISSKDEATVAE